MIRRSKLKVRPAIRKSQSSLQGSVASTPGTPTQKIKDVRHADNNKHIALVGQDKIDPSEVISLSQPVAEIKTTDTENTTIKASDLTTLSQPVAELTPISTESTQINKDDKVNDKQTQKSAVLPRRRKLVACPMTAKKRQKISADQQKEKNEYDQSEEKNQSETKIASTPPVSNNDIISMTSETPPTPNHEPFVNVHPGLDSNKLPPIENLLSPLPMVSQTNVMDQVEHSSPMRFATLTPVTADLEPVESDVNTEFQDTDKADSLTNSNPNVSLNSEVVAVANNPSELVNSTSSILAPIKGRSKTVNAADKPRSTKSHSDKKVEYITKKLESIAKAPSATAKHRLSAYRKLKELKKNQEDENQWPEFDQNVVSMSDLIFLNPPNRTGFTLGMNVRQEQAREEILAQKQEAAAAEPEKGPEKSNSEKTDEDSALPVPQIRIADDGSVVIDEDSLVLDTQKPVDPKISTVYEFGKESTINQCSFMRRPYKRTANWTLDETEKFYKCLCIVGAEFSLMGAMFRGRTPDDLRRKFKRERKKNPNRIDKALMQQHLSKWTDDMFEPPEELDDNDNTTTLNNEPLAEETVK